MITQFMQTFATFVVRDCKSFIMKVLVTGANGLLGHHIVFELLRRNYQAAIIVRSERNIFFNLSRVEVHIGNFTDYNQLTEAARGCDAIIHTAAVTATDLLHYEDYERINSKGAKLVVRVAEELDIQRIVFVSTANTVGFGDKNRLANETSPISFPFSESFYARSKVAAEEIFREAAGRTGKHIIIINPTFMIGPVDPKPSSGELMLRGYKKRMLFVPRGGKNFVPVKDVAEVACNALTQGRSGERYLASGVNLSFADFYSLQKKIGNYTQIIFPIPDFCLKILGWVGDLFRKVEIKTEICSMNLNQLIIREYYSNKKVIDELSMKPTDLKIAIKEALDWFREEGKI